MRIGTIMAVGTLLLCGCASWLGAAPSANLPSVIEHSQYCGSSVATARLFYFRQPAAFAQWVDDRDLEDLNPKAVTGPVLLLGMGRRPTTGYALELLSDQFRVEGNTLVLRVDWVAPDPDAYVGPGLTSPCLVLSLPSGHYRRVQVIDQSGDQRVALALK